MPDLSVIICTHNPKADYLRRVLDALKSQTLPKDQWELLLIDNACSEPLEKVWDMAWHPQARHIREIELGLTPARLRGIKESHGKLLVFVDDDNVLDASYLENAIAIGGAWPILGVWGGQVEPEFETAPEEWTKQYWHLLALKAVPHDRWANFPSVETFPVGAGMCVRKSVGLEYKSELSANSKRRLLDRRGQALTSGGDMDIFLTACQAGFGTGVFARLKLKHLIPLARLEENYLVRLVEGVSYSTRAMDHLNSPGVVAGRLEPRLKRWLKKIKNRIGELFLDGRERRFHHAALRGWAMADVDFAKQATAVSQGNSHFRLPQ